MMIIANSGQARSDAFAALQEAKKGNFEDAEKLLKEAEESLQTDVYKRQDRQRRFDDMPAFL